MQNDFASSADIRLAETLLAHQPADSDQFGLIKSHLTGTYLRARAGETDALEELMSLLVSTYTLARSALALADDHPPQQALQLAADYHAACADERSDE